MENIPVKTGSKGGPHRAEAKQAYPAIDTGLKYLYSLPMLDVLFVVLAGGLGSALRYLLSLSASRLVGTHFPWGTMVANLAGCLAIGFAAGLVDRSLLPRAWRLAVITGFLGGFTTFSTFSLESLRLILDGAVLRGLVNLGVNLLGGLFLAGLGLHLAERVGR